MEQYDRPALAGDHTHCVWDGAITQDGNVVGMWEVAGYTAGWHKSSAVPGHTVDRHLPWFAADISNLWPDYTNMHRVIVIARPDY
ncbi:MAG: hypothetical protein ACP5R2_09550 [Anaerolineae bacterium]